MVMIERLPGKQRQIWVTLESFPGKQRQYMVTIQRLQGELDRTEYHKKDCHVNRDRTW